MNPESFALNLVMKDVTARRTEENRIATARSKFIWDPTKAQTMISKLLEPHVPEGKKIATKKHPSRLSAVQAAIPKSDPRHEMGTEVWKDYSRLITDPAYSKYRPEDLVMASFVNRLKEKKEAIHEHTWKQKSSPLRTFFKTPVAELPDQEAWEVAKPRSTYSSVGASFALGAATKGIPQAIARIPGVAPKALKWAGQKGIMKLVGRGLTAAPHPVAKAAGLGLMFIPDLLAFDIAGNMIRKTEWAQNRPWKALLAELTVGGVAVAGTQKVAKKAVTMAVRRFASTAVAEEAASTAAATLPTAETLNKAAEATAARGAAQEHLMKNLEKGRLGLVNALSRKIEKGVETGQIWREVESKAPLAAKRSPHQGVVPIIEKPKTPAWLRNAEELAGGQVEKEPLLYGAKGKPVRYKLKDIEREEKVIEFIGKGKTADQAIQEVGAMEKVRKDRFVLEPVGKVKNLAYQTKNKLKKMGYSDTDISNMGARQAQVFSKMNIHKVGFDKATDTIQKTVRKTVAKAAKEETLDIPASFPKKLAKLEKERDFGDKDLVDLREKIKGTRKKITETVKLFKQDKLPKQITKTAEAKTSVVQGLKDEISAAPAFKAVKVGERFESKEYSKFSGAFHNKLDKLFKEKKITREEWHSLSNELGEKNPSAILRRENAAKARAKAEAKAQETVSATTLGEEQFDAMADLSAKVAEGEYERAFSALEKAKVKTAYSAYIKGTATAKETAITEASVEANWGALKKLLYGLVGATTVLSLSEVLGPRKAEAGMVDTGARVVTKLTGEMLKKAKGKGLKILLEELETAGLIPKPSLNPYALGDPMRSIVVTPKLSDIRKKKEIPLGLSKLLTPYAQYHWFAGTNAEGLETMTNPAVQLAMARTAAHVNTEEGLKVFNRIVKDVPGYKESYKEVSAAMAPLEKEYMTQMAERGYHGWMGKKLGKDIEAKWKAIEKRKNFKGKGKRKIEDGDVAALKALEAEMNIHKKAFEGSEAMYKQYIKGWDEAIKPLAAKHPSVRIFLGSEDTAAFKHYPWLKDTLSFEEEVAIGRIKDMMEEQALRLMDVNGKPLLYRPYMYHAAHPDRDFKALQKHIHTVNPHSDVTPPMAKLHSRSFGLRPMMPDASYTMQRYLPDINVRMQYMDFWKYKKPGGWHEFSRSSEVQNTDGLRRFFDAFEAGFKPLERGPASDWAETAYSVEVARLLAFSASVPFKHAMKLTADLRVFGAEGAKNIPEAIRTFSRSSFKKSGNSAWLEKRGLKSDSIDSIVKAWTNQGKMHKLIADIDTFRVPETGWKRILQKFNEIGGAPVAAVEKYDRGFSVLCGLEMAAKKGMTPSQAAYSVFDTILKTNFLAGPNNPGWLRDPMIRLFLTFQGTPFKIIEQRGLLYGRTGKAVGKASKELLRQLRLDVKEGEHKLKWSLIKGALESERDLFGTPVVKQFMREMLAVGTIIGTGRMVFDADMKHHMFHPPFIKFNTKEIAIGASPLATATYRTWMDKEHKDDEFWMSTFFKEWFGRANKGFPIPANFTKALRLSKDDIPTIYKDSRLKYIFAIPAVGEGH